MASTCGDPDRLIKHIANSYPKATPSPATAIGTVKITFPDGLIVNVFKNGTVNFQGKASDVRGEIEAQIDIINRE
ncbi:hypothetical protein [Roseateles noduli]|uniref:hypothetical protein n=1 Tax=Roseateles noduli TaxID=2052484 RepID=UPI003D651C2E